MFRNCKLVSKIYDAVPDLLDNNITLKTSLSYYIVNC